MLVRLYTKNEIDNLEGGANVRGKKYLQNLETDICMTFVSFEIFKTKIPGCR
jgi:hypothetical protein